MIKSKFQNFFVITIMALLLSMPCCYAQNQDINITPKTKVQKNTELNQVIKKFTKSMFLVIGSSIAVYFLLVMYKRFRSNKNNNGQKNNLANDLNSPESIDDAIKFVIEKF